MLIYSREFNSHTLTDTYLDALYTRLCVNVAYMCVAMGQVVNIDQPMDGLRTFLSRRDDRFVNSTATRTTLQRW